MIYCEDCGNNRNVKYSEDFKRNLCMNCLSTNIEHPINPIPKPGEVRYDLLGRPICHICGRAYNRLMQHARQKHLISAKEYKVMFGLNTSKGIISTHSAEILREHVDRNYEVVVRNNLLKNGKKTRFGEGYEGRTKDKLSLQALIGLQNKDR